MPTVTPTVQSDVLDTPELKAPAQVADKHRARVTSFKYEVLQNKETGKQTPVFRLNLHSLDREFDTQYSMWVPRGFAADIHVDPNTLPEEEGNKQRTSYSISISNARKTADLQKLRQYAQEQGNFVTPDSVEAVLGEGRTAPSTIEEYAAILNKQLTGIEVVFYRKPQTSDDPRYDGRLEVKGVTSIDVVNDPAKLKAYRAAWAETLV